ncbi:hypothetical protein ACSSUR_24335 [Pseudomonas cedrina]|uniref:hypothetical protein n=1 Tax=Pseudomonas cedrina TaxID=651740 RepID=UPI003ED9951A
MDRLDDRSHFEAVGDIRYALRYFHLQSRLFGKIDGLFRLISVVAGSSSFAGFLAGSPRLAGIAALITAVVTALDIVWSPGNKRLICSELSKRYTELDRKSKKLDLEELDEELWRLRETDAPAIEALRVPAYNDSVSERSLASYKLTTTWWQNFVASLA